MSIVIPGNYLKQYMTSQHKPLLAENAKDPLQRHKKSQNQSQNQQYQQQLLGNASEDDSDSSSYSSGWSSEVIQPAIKTMSFRSIRGTRMKELIKGKRKSDQFWDKYQGFFGGDLNEPDDSDDKEDYQASSSGRDQFDSDFDLTDSYVGKRGRKKGTKMKRRKKPITKEQHSKEETEKVKGRRGRKKKVTQQSQQKKQHLCQKIKNQKMQSEQKSVSIIDNKLFKQTHKRIQKYQIISEHQDDYFIIEHQSRSKRQSKNTPQNRISANKQQRHKDLQHQKPLIEKDKAQ